MIKERAIVIPEGTQIQVMLALMDCYKKHVLGDDSIGWDELSDKMSCALQEVMGDDGFSLWLKAVSPDEHT